MTEEIIIDIYLNSIFLAVGIDEKEFDDLYYRNVTRIADEEYKLIRKDIADKNSCNGLTMQLDCGNVFMFIRKGQERKYLTVAHEIFHAAHNVLKRAGVVLDADGEAYAYLVGWLMNEYYCRLDDYENGNGEQNTRR